MKHKADINQLLQKYYSGKMTEQEKNILEKEAMDNAFLKDAMDGFDNFPHAAVQVKLNVSDQNLLKFNKLYLFLGTVLTLALCSILIFTPDKKTENQITENDLQNDKVPLEKHEVDIYPQEIDTLKEIEVEELILPEEIASDRKEIQKKINYSDNSLNSPIVIEDETNFPEENLELMPEGNDYTLAELVPATYLFDLFVVDYRRIEREKKEVEYIKYELTGTSAEFENQNSTDNEVTETKVKVSYWIYLSQSMDYFSRENYKGALNRFEIILDQYPNDVNALFYGGLCYYNLGSYNKAIDHFEKIIDQPLNAFKEEALWYKAKSLIKLNRKKEASAVLDEIIIQGGFYTEDAIELKKKLR